MSDEKGLAIRQPGIIQSFDDVDRAAQALSKSGYFQDAREIAQCVTKILAGRELGFGPFASMTGIHIIQGRPSIGANLMAAAVKGSGRYNYRVTEMSDKVCTIDFYEGKEKIGTSSFNLEDAKKAQTKNLDKFPRNMLFARAMSNGVRWFTPDVFNGSAVYTPEELGAEVNEDGDVIAGQFVTVPEPPKNGNGKAQPTEPPAEPSPFDEPPAQPKGPIASKQEQVIAHMTAKTNLARKHVENTLAKCKLPQTATLADFETWWDLYRGERSTGKTSDEAAAFANDTMLPQPTA